MTELMSAGAKFSQIIFVLTTCVLLVYLVLVTTVAIAQIDYKFKYNKQLLIVIASLYGIGLLFALWSAIFALLMVVAVVFGLKFLFKVLV